jgi:hypothetical protein
MKLIDDARNWWRMRSVQMMGAAVAIQGAWTAIPDDMRNTIPHRIVSGITIALLLLGIAGRLTQQPFSKPPDPPKDNPS